MIGVHPWGWIDTNSDTNAHEFQRSPANVRLTKMLYTRPPINTSEHSAQHCCSEGPQFKATIRDNSHSPYKPPSHRIGDAHHAVMKTGEAIHPLVSCTAIQHSIPRAYVPIV